jgi:hypothetical protein
MGDNMRFNAFQWIQTLAACAILALAGCGDESTAAAGCGECPEDHYCSEGPYGPFCQSPFSRDGDGGLQDMLPNQGTNGGSAPNDGVYRGRQPNGGNNDGENGAANSGNNGVNNGADNQNGDNQGNQVEGCDEVRLLLKPSQGSIPRVMLVVDRSFSMVVEEDRWGPIENTLSRVTESLGDIVHFGLAMFPAPNPSFRGSEAEMACAAGEVNVGTAGNTSQEIARWLSDYPPERGLATPTHSALEAAGRHLREAPTGNDYILLATDGGPGCNFGLNHNICTCLNHACVLGLPEMCLDDQRTVTKVEELAAEGIQTIVLGIASEEFMPESRAVLDRMAVAGGTALEGRHFEVNRVADLERNLTEAAGNLAPCTYDLGQFAEFEESLSISIDGNEVPRDPSHQNGWDISNGSVEFFGVACQSLRDGDAHEISAGCN